MYVDDTLRSALTRIVAVGIILLSGYGVALAQPGPPLDQDKLLFDPVGGWILYYTDTDLDGWHDPGEPYFGAPGGNDSNSDNSCWMASATNMLQYEGAGNAYLGWLGTGGAPSPIANPWGGMLAADGGGASMTFDDGGWQDWAITFAGHPIQGPITTPAQFAVWAIDPIAWCQTKLAADHAVGLTIHWGMGLREDCPDRPVRVDLRADCGYHAITLWEIDEIANTVRITDSDDVVAGARIVPYTFVGNDWVLTGIYPGIDAHVNYAVSFPEDWGIPTVSEWGMMVMTLLALTAGTILYGRGRRPAAM